MYIGHVAIALGSKGLWRDAPLWLLVVAAHSCDWVDAAMCGAGVEPNAMWSHSILAVAVIAVALALVARASGSARTVAVVVAGTVASHLVVDYITGKKPTWPGGPAIGLNLYHHPGWEFVVEAVVITAGWLLYRGSLRPAERTSRPAYLLLVVLLGLQFTADAKVALKPSLSKCQWSVPPKVQTTANALPSIPLAGSKATE